MIFNLTQPQNLITTSIFTLYLCNVKNFGQLATLIKFEILYRKFGLVVVSVSTFLFADGAAFALQAPLVDAGMAVDCFVALVTHQWLLLLG